MPNYINNKLMNYSTIKSQILHNHRRSTLQTLSINKNQKNKLHQSINHNKNTNRLLLKRSSHCASNCQPQSCCTEAKCLCIRDYWGPVCYCKK